jgi:hypothetical protein
MWNPDDGELMDELRAALRAEETPPESFVQAAKAAYAWRDLDAELELLTLTFDSAVETGAVVRGPAVGERMLVFESDEATVTLEVDLEVLMGQIVPVRAVLIALEGPGGVLEETEADDSGFFLLRRPPAGTVRLKWRGGVSGVTEWVAI